MLILIPMPLVKSHVPDTGLAGKVIVLYSHASEALIANSFTIALSNGEPLPREAHYFPVFVALTQNDKVTGFCAKGSQL